MAKPNVFWRILSIGTAPFLITANANQPKLHLVTEHLPPYQIVDNKGNITGLATDIVHHLMRQTGINYDLNAYSWQRSYNLALQKTNYCIYSIARVPAREQLFQWVGRLTETNNAVIWGLKSQNIKINQLADIKNYVTAVSRNDVTHIGMLAHGFIEGEHLYVLENTKPLLKMWVNRPEINFIVADDITIRYRSKLAGIEFDRLQRVWELTDLPLNFYLACSNKTSKIITSKLTKQLNSIHRSGQYQHIYQQWQKKIATQQLKMAKTK